MLIKKYDDFIGAVIEIVVGIGSFIITYLCWKYTFGDKVSAEWFIFIVALLLIVAGIFIKLWFKARDVSNIIPKLVSISNDFWVFEKSDLFVSGAVVTILEKKNNVEETIAIGKVALINTSGRIQVRPIYKRYEHNVSYFQKHSDCIILKPTVDIDILNNYVENQKSI